MKMIRELKCEWKKQRIKNSMKKDKWINKKGVKYWDSSMNRAVMSAYCTFTAGEERIFFMDLEMINVRLNYIFRLSPIGPDYGCRAHLLLAPKLKVK